MQDFNRLAYLYLKKKRNRELLKPKTIRYIESIKNIDPFHLMVTSMINVLKFLEYDTEDIENINNDKIQYIQNFYDRFISDKSIKDGVYEKLMLDNYSYKQANYYDHLGDLFKSFNLEFSSIIKFYLYKTKKEFESHDLDIIIFFIMITKFSSTFQKTIDNSYASLNLI